MYNPNRAQGETYPIENRSQVETLTRTYIFNTQKRLFLICPVDNLGRGQTSDIRFSVKKSNILQSSSGNGANRAQERFFWNSLALVCPVGFF